MLSFDISYWDTILYFGLILPSIALWGAKFKLLQPGLKILGFALHATVSIESYAAYLMIQRITNLHVYHLLIPVQYALYSLVFYVTLTVPRNRKAVLFSIPIYLLAVFLIMSHLQDASQFNSFARFLKHLFISCIVLLYYREIFNSLQIIRLNKEPMFWVSAGLFFYSLGNFFVDGVMNHVLGESFQLAHTLYYVNVFLGLLLNITFLISFILPQPSTMTVDKEARNHF